MPKHRKSSQPPGGYQRGKRKSGNTTNIARRNKGQPESDEQWQTLVNDPNNWQVPVFGEPHFVDPRSRKIVPRVDCPLHIQRVLKLQS
ncbi:hypothetical protein ACFLTS_05595 [Chloroflexota bacterium]